MSKLEELINELCPNGVEYKKIKEVTEMKRGSSLTKKNAVEGVYPVVSGGRLPAFYCDKFNREGETITVAGSGIGAGYVQYWNEPIFANDCFTLKGDNQVITKFVYYYLKSIQKQIYETKKGGGVPHCHISSIENFSENNNPPYTEIFSLKDNLPESSKFIYISCALLFIFAPANYLSIKWTPDSSIIICALSKTRFCTSSISARASNTKS